MILSNLCKISIPCFIFSHLAQAGQVANHGANSNDRFADNAAFIGSSFDLSGVGRTSDGNWATRIGDNYYLSANHFHSGTNETVTFHSSNSPVATAYSYQTAGGFQIAGSDLWLGYFNESIDSSIKTYGYNTTAANSLADAGLTNKDVYMLGNSPTADATYGGPGKLTDMVLAENRAESWLETGTNTVDAPEATNSFVDSNNNPVNATWDQIVTFRNVAGDDALTQRFHEGQLLSGDSGSPLFSVAAGQLQVEGIAYAVVTGGGGFTGNFVDQEFMPEEISGIKLFEPGNNARENEMRKNLHTMWKEKYGY